MALHDYYMDPETKDPMSQDTPAGPNMGNQGPMPNDGAQPFPTPPGPTAPTTSAPVVTAPPPPDYQPYGGAGAAPVFTPPPAFEAPEFTMPQPGDDPSYDFRLNQGLDAAQRSAAARGVLNSGGTIRDLQDYAQGFASQEYANTFDRAMRAYEARYKGAFDEWSSKYGISRDVYQSMYDPWALNAQQSLAAWQSWLAHQQYEEGLDAGAVA